MLNSHCITHTFVLEWLGEFVLWACEWRVKGEDSPFSHPLQIPGKASWSNSCWSVFWCRLAHRKSLRWTNTLDTCHGSKVITIFLTIIFINKLRYPHSFVNLQPQLQILLVFLELSSNYSHWHSMMRGDESNLVFQHHLLNQSWYSDTKHRQKQISVDVLSIRQSSEHICVSYKNSFFQSLAYPYQLQFSLSVSRQTYIIQYGEFGSSLIRWKLILQSFLTTSLNCFLLEWLGEFALWAWDWKG